MEYSWAEQFIKTFVPLFIVIDAFGNLPFVISMSEGMARSERNRMVLVAVFTAAIVGLAFLFLGRFVLNLMGIPVGSFAIGGGLILLVLSIRFILTGQVVEAIKEEMVAVVPIGTPLTVGPATITALLLLATQFPLYMVLLSFALNILVAWIVFMLSNWFASFLGQGGIKAVSKVFSLLLAAIAVSMIIDGLRRVGILAAGI
ncbi:MAG: MarC family protein [Chloroflexi bacterium]|nr:MarC family protein [Chloroflexota bacterium]